MKGILFAFLCGALAAGAAELPVRQVVLYKHGVGFFERSGRLGPGESARLDFNATEMNDVLKSLTIEEKGGGKITGLRYDSMDPLSHKLGEFSFQIGEGKPLSAILGQLKGARIELQFGNAMMAGAIVDAREIAATDKQPEREQITLLMDSGELRTLDLSAAAAIRFPDAQLQQQFRDYLAAVAMARSKDKRSVYIDSTDAKERDVTASYMIPAAVWKSSYRLIFGAAGQPVLEGWAMVDNTTGEDWDKVQLSLVSGRPISFVSQLYAPKYVERPTAELADDAAARPVVHEGGYGGVAAGTAGGVMGGVIGAARKAAPPPGFNRNGTLGTTAEMVTVEAEAAPSTIASTASARELGDLFEYRIAQPVTIRKNESAMLPFLQQAIEARKLLIYSDRTSQHPTNAAELTNSTGKTLDGGPITVYDGGAYGGEALMETLKAGDKRLISYAVDLGTRITDKFKLESAVMRKAHAERGVLTITMAAEETRTYTIRNIDQKAKTLIIEHPLRPGYTLLNQKPAEKTARAYRFEIQLAPGATQEFAVSEERVYLQATEVSNMTPESIMDYVQNSGLMESGRRQLQRIADLKRQIDENDDELSAAVKQSQELTKDEERIRQNIASLNAVSGQQQQVQNYARQLDVHEQQLASLRDRKAELEKKKTALEAELDKLIEALAF